MLRSQGIPTKMVKGYAKDSTIYHAWNEIYLEKEKRWIVVDVTSDAYLLQNGSKIQFERVSTSYTKIKEL
jgi:transglutaminase-like putative cysteine protease